MEDKRLDDALRYIQFEVRSLNEKLTNVGEPNSGLVEEYEKLFDYIEQQKKAYPDHKSEFNTNLAVLSKGYNAYLENTGQLSNVPEEYKQEKEHEVESGYTPTKTDFGSSGVFSSPSMDEEVDVPDIGFWNRHPRLKKATLGAVATAFILGSVYLAGVLGKYRKGRGEDIVPPHVIEQVIEKAEKAPMIFEDKKACEMIVVRHPFDSKEIIEGREGLEEFVKDYYNDLSIYSAASIDGPLKYNFGLTGRRSDNVEHVVKLVKSDVNVNEKKALGERTNFGKSLKDNRVSVVSNMVLDDSKLGAHPDGKYGVVFNCDDAVIHKIPKKKDHISKDGKKCDELVKKVDDLEKKLKKCEERECPQPPQTPQPPPQPPQVPIEPEDQRDKINYPEFYEGEEKVEEVEEVDVVGKELEVKDTDVGPVDFEYRIEENEVPSVKVLRNKDTVSDNSLELKIYNVNNNEVFDTLRLDKRETIDLDDGRVQDTYKGKEKLILPDVDKEGNRTKHEADIEVNVDKVDEQSKLEGIIDSAKNYVIGTAHASGGFGGNLPFAKIIKKKGVEIKEVWVHCIDGIDNDLDGKIDYPNDPGCTSALDNNEIDLVGPNDDEPVVCGPSDWECTDWSPCDENSKIKTRTCTKINLCEGDTGKPDEKDSCNDKVIINTNYVRGDLNWVNELENSEEIKYKGDFNGIGAEFGYWFNKDLNVRLLMHYLNTKADVETLVSDADYKGKVIGVGIGTDFKIKNNLISGDLIFENRKAKQRYDLFGIEADVKTDNVILDVGVKNRNLFNGEQYKLGLGGDVIQVFSDIKQEVVVNGVTQPGGLSDKVRYGVYEIGPVFNVDKDGMNMNAYVRYVLRERPDLESDKVLNGQGIRTDIVIGKNTRLKLFGEIPFGNELERTDYGVLFGQNNFRIGDMKIRLPGWELGLWKFDERLLTESDVLRKEELRFIFELQWNFDEDNIRFWDRVLQFN